ncbi:bacterio-opsin activator domain-containing protein [Natronorubrum sulfidifaciens]|uniref:Response regulator receiver modulated GAF sensor protein n=1 Tax=Natronorubrum sulfidifaciens JCM 14089 TaxID=1230460 RepID=L9WBJ1_9EURY|nr:bacterio-opsin activator domain-containing protein [Natronorubrum sulfidifaciens]ELY46631.1 response regulator receiver modulated GAF sensor protein [Natronorubrum sulfidifaciens JCM 14089]
MTPPISVLVVDNEPGFADLVGEMLEREHEAIVAESAMDAGAALSILEERSIDCIVSDYEMPQLTGLELLEQVRTDDPELPFILFTGRGSEELASDAIAAGVTQYLQKESGKKQYALLANQITNAVSQYRTETALRESERRYERTLTTLHETTRELMRASTKGEIYRSAVETAGEILDVPVATAYAFEPVDGLLEHVASATESGTFADPEQQFERESGRVWDVFSEGESAYYEDVRRESSCPKAVTRSELLVPLGTHGVLIAGTVTVDGIDETMTELLHILAANTEAALDRAEREQLLRENDRTLTQQNEELTRLNHTNEVVREITHGVTQASTRTEIETRVCERLADTERYRFAWIASSDTDPPEPTSWAGVDGTFIDQVCEPGVDAPEQQLIGDALEDERVQVVRNVLEADGWSHRRKAALTYGYQTILAVPLRDDERRYGVLLVHVAGTDSIGERERAVLGELGETIGHAIRAVERTRAMLTDSRLELELACHDSRLLLNRLAEHAGGPVAIEGVLDRDDEAVVFGSVPRETELATVEQWASIETLSVVSEGDSELLVEMRVSSAPVLEILRTSNIQLRTATAQNGTSLLVLEVPQRVETRSVLETFRQRYPETELEARRETTSARSTRQLDTHLEEELTDRQLEALQAAYYSGFFEWPRESTAEELAAVLDISAPTYHYHLRAAERKLVTVALDRNTE